MQFCSEIILVISVELALRAFLIWNHASVISDQLLTSYWSDFNKILTTKNIDVRFCSEHPEWCQKTDCPLNHDNEHPRPFFYWSPSPHVNYLQSWTNKWRIKTPLPLPSPRGFILDLGVGGGGGCCSILFGPRLELVTDHTNRNLSQKASKLSGSGIDQRC